MLQFPLIAAVFVAGRLGPSWPESASRALSIAGAVVAVGGGLLVVASARALGGALSPFPRPRSDARVVERGPYRVVRHPIYAGGTLFLAGFSLAFSPLALAAAALLLVVWGLKAKVEERFLVDALPGYAQYRRRTRHMLVPFVY